ncbi:MAG: putative bifunctional diguanylate cyclase/phosphodiesterase [Casimicrobiaceae bacterium]
MKQPDQHSDAPILRLYAALSHTNSAIVRIRDPQLLFNEICSICVEHGDAKIAYIAMADESGYARPVASAGPAEDFLAGIEIPLSPSLGAGQGPVALAIQHGEPYIANDLHADASTSPWRDRAALLGSNATAAFPIHRGGRIVGALSLHVEQRDFFDAAVIDLVLAMVGDLSYALDNIDREAERMVAVREMEAGLERFKTIFTAAPVAIAIWTEGDGQLVDANDAFCVLLGVARGNPADKEFSAAIDCCRVDLDLRGCVERLRSGHRVRDHEARLRSLSGHTRDVSVNAELIEFRQHRCVLTIIADTTERKVYEASLEHFATHDGLTGLPNRHLFYDRAAQALGQSRRANTVTAIMLVDLDRMKVINDELGHRIGDIVLQLVGERLSSVLANGDSVARLGGNKFVLLLAALRSPSDAHPRADQICASFAAPFWVLGHELRLTASSGVAVYPGDGVDVDALVRNATLAMYSAKRLGNGARQFFAPEMAKSANPNLDLQTHLGKALELEQLYVEYQPKVGLSNGAIGGVEALLRWRHPDLGVISPATFIPLAEESGLIGPIGEWVLREACAQNAAWQQLGLPRIPISVNVSARQLLDSGFADQVRGALRDTGLAAQWLEIELTETTIAKDVDRITAFISELKSLGARFAIDDFGTGYSSLAYLRRFQVDRLKIDQSFIRNVTSDPGDAAIVRAIISLAKSLGIGVTAEGVETEEQCALLRQQECDEIQGYLFSRPVSAQSFADLLRTNHKLVLPASDLLGGRGIHGPARFAKAH